MASPGFGALVLCIKPTSSLPVIQIPILQYEIRYGCRRANLS